MTTNIELPRRIRVELSWEWKRNPFILHARFQQWKHLSNGKRSKIEPVNSLKRSVYDVSINYFIQLILRKANRAAM
jgi:hypothetical protein